MGKSKQQALVTGASSGIGRETAVKLAQNGFEVLAVARRLERLQELAERVEGIRTWQTDLTREEELEALCAHLAGREDPVTVLVNNAGYSIRGGLEDVELAVARRLFEVNVFGLMRVTQACLPGMRRLRRGTIVNISSMAGKFTFPLSGVYAATKHAVEAISDSLRMELRPFGIRVVAIRPGFIATEFNDVAGQMTGDLMARTPADYKPLYQASGAAVGKLFANATVTGPEPIAELVLQAVLAEKPKPVYSGGFLSEEFLSKRFSLDDEGFDQYMAEKTGLLALKV